MFIRLQARAIGAPGAEALVRRHNGATTVFSHNYQPKLAELFRNGNPIPIDFGLGYRWRLNQSNLLLAQKKVSDPNGN
jgi:hypothetical protein